MHQQTLRPFRCAPSVNRVSVVPLGRTRPALRCRHRQTQQRPSIQISSSLSPASEASQLLETMKAAGMQETSFWCVLMAQQGGPNMACMHRATVQHQSSMLHPTSVVPACHCCSYCRWPLALSTMAGLSTSIGGVIAVRCRRAGYGTDTHCLPLPCCTCLLHPHGLNNPRIQAASTRMHGRGAQVVRKPAHQALAGMLGLAIGVMATVSVVELIVRNAMENDTFLVMARWVRARAGCLIAGLSGVGWGPGAGGHDAWWDPKWAGIAHMLLVGEGHRYSIYTPPGPRCTAQPCC